MISINRMMVQGNLGKDPTVHTFPSGKTKAELSVATNSKYRNAEGQEIKQTEWHNVILWGKQAEVASKYLRKGDTICVVGPIETRTWEKDGVKSYRKELRAKEFSFQTKTRAADANQHPDTEDNSGYVPEPTDMPNVSEEDLPF